MTTTPLNATQQLIFDSTGVSPIAAATITMETLSNTNSSLNGNFNIVNQLFFLRAGGTESVDYLIAPSGPVLLDQTVTLANGARVNTYYGSESFNPFLAATPAIPATATTVAVPAFSPPSPGYALTQYTYGPGGVFLQVLAVEANGKSFIGTPGGGIG